MIYSIILVNFVFLHLIMYIITTLCPIKSVKFNLNHESYPEKRFLFHYNYPMYLSILCMVVGLLTKILANNIKYVYKLNTKVSSIHEVSNSLYIYACVYHIKLFWVVKNPNIFMGFSNMNLCVFFFLLCLLAFSSSSFGGTHIMTYMRHKVSATKLEPYDWSYIRGLPVLCP